MNGVKEQDENGKGYEKIQLSSSIQYRQNYD